MSELENIVLDPTVPNLASESVQNLIPPKKKFPFLLYISLILLSVVSVISIYLFLQVRQLTLEKLTPSPTPTPSPSADPTEGWETYTNTRYNYSFRYPSNLIIQSGVELLSANENERNLSTTNTIDVLDNNDTIVQVVSVKKFETLEETKKSITVTNADKSPEYIDFEIQSQPAFKYFDGDSTFVMTIQGNYFYQIYLSKGSVEKESISTKILSTLKFTDSEKSNLPKKYYLSSGKFFDTRPYPTELTSLKDTDLTGFSCSDKYTKRENNEYVFRKYGSGEGAGYEDTNLTDKPVLEYLQANGADEAVVCKTDTGRTLLSYGIFGKGGGVGSATYYGYLEGNNPSVATIPTENGPYFTCGTILAITKSNTLYVECLSGDGGFGSKSLYRVGLYKAYTSDLLLKCTTTMQDESSTPKITCGTTQ